MQINPFEIARCRRAAAAKGSGGGEDRYVAVGIVDKPFLHGAGEVDQRRDVPIGILPGVEPLIQAGAGDAEIPYFPICQKESRPLFLFLFRLIYFYQTGSDFSTLDCRIPDTNFHLLAGHSRKTHNIRIQV
jgi:hypothetical protein